MCLVATLLLQDSLQSYTTTIVSAGKPLLPYVMSMIWVILRRKTISEVCGYSKSVVLNLNAAARPHVVVTPNHKIICAATS